ncbi:hypothetical protein OUZ56_029947 [Daphnia magna]|uniref:Uncharacterized protein n=1 Tax=Daphnia magna TaxID=35525 RepID=A0ABR0B8C2_9CRUS|nr:hypothetical protein OUZ56_029947 [Daphnia magna]
MGVSIDLFASSWNAQLSVFVGWLPQPGAWRTNAFAGADRDGPDMPTVEEPTVVPAFNGNGSRDPVNTPTRTPPPVFSGGQPTLPGTRRLDLANRTEVIRGDLSSKGIWPGVVELLLVGVRPTTQIAYQSGKAYETVNVARSMLSVTLPPIEDQPVGQHYLVLKLMKAVCNSKPKAKLFVNLDAECQIKPASLIEKIGNSPSGHLYSANLGVSGDRQAIRERNR